MSTPRPSVVGPIVAVVAVTVGLTAVLHAVAATRVADAAGLGSTFALLGASACVLLGGFAAWYLGRVHAGAEAFAASAQAEVARLQQRLGGALEREREFSGHVAHELRTPLAVLRTGLDLLLRKQSPGTELHDQLLELLETVDEMSRLTDNLMLLTRIEGNADKPVMQPVAVRSLVDAVWRRFESRAHDRGLRFDNRVDAAHHIEADRAKLQIVVQNLLANAVSYTETGGAIVVDIGADTLLTVWDSGPQLPPEQLERVFDRMWRADAARTDANRHAGLGLSLARGLCRHMGMGLAVENLDRGGLHFVLRALPAAESTAP